MTRFARRAVEVAGIEKAEARAAATAVAASAVAAKAAEAAATVTTATATAARSTVHHLGVVSAEGEGQSGQEAYASQGQMPADLERDRVQAVASDAI